MFDEFSSFSRKRRIQDYKEYAEIVEITMAGKHKIDQKDINAQMMELWDAGLITDKDGKYKKTESDETDSEDEVPGSAEPKYRRIKIME